MELETFELRGVRVAGIDLLTLDLHAQLLRRLDDAPAAAAEGTESEDESEEASGPLTLAIDVADASAGETPGADAEAADKAPGPA